MIVEINTIARAIIITEATTEELVNMLVDYKGYKVTSKIVHSTYHRYNTDYLEPIGKPNEITCKDINGPIGLFDNNSSTSIA